MIQSGFAHAIDNLFRITARGTNTWDIYDTTLNKEYSMIACLHKAILTKQPFSAIKYGIHSCVKNTTCFKLEFMVLSYSASVTFSNRFCVYMPALFTNMFILPNFLIASSTTNLRPSCVQISLTTTWIFMAIYFLENIN